MSTKSKNHLTYHFAPNGFGGIDLKSPKENASEVYNFRVMPDGSIMKRQGFRTAWTLPGAPSYFGIFNINSSEVGIAVIGDKMFEVDLANGKCTQYEGSLDQSAALCSVVSYNENMLIFDGLKVKLVRNKEIVDLNGYAPLYGKSWHPIELGSINEPLNMASDRYRINYSLSSTTVQIRLPSNVVRIDYVELNGRGLYSTDYTFNPTTGFVSSEHFSSNEGSVTFWVTFNNTYASLFNGCTRALSVSSGNSPIVFCYGKNGSDGIYCLRSVPFSKGVGTSRVYPDEFELYIPIDCSFSVGSGANTVRAVIPYDERVIVFTDHDAWFVPIVSDSVMPSPLSKSIGCSSPYGAAYISDSPVTVCHNRLFIWTPTLDPYNPLNAVSVSSEVNLPEHKADRFVKVFVNRYDSELWIFNENSKTDNILIYNYESKKWFSFGDFYPSFVFNYNGQVGFIEGAGIYLFYDDALFDERQVGHSEDIRAIYTSGWTKIDDTGKVKYADRLIVEAFTGTCGGLSIKLFYNNERCDNVWCYTMRDSMFPHIFVKHLPHSRFREVRFQIIADGSDCERVHDIALELTVNDGNQY